MKIDIMTLFPEMINAVMRESIIGRAQDKGLVEVKATNIRDYALDKHHKADDAPYGGGRGQVMLAEPLYLCHEALSAGEHVHTVFLSAQGAPFNQERRVSCSQRSTLFWSAATTRASISALSMSAWTRRFQSVTSC